MMKMLGVFCIQTLRTVRFHATLSALLAVPLMLGMFMMYKDSTDMKLIVVIFLAGALGGITNTYLRLKDVPSVTPVWDKLSTANLVAIMQVWTTPLIAGLFGVLLYAIFASGLIKGGLFPEFNAKTPEYSNLANMFSNFTPKEQADAVKTIVWGYVAGFSERMIPNILDRMAQEVNSKNNEPA